MTMRPVNEPGSSFIRGKRGRVVMKSSARKTLPQALQSMLPALERSFAEGHIFTESDLNYVIVRYLHETLPKPTRRCRWVIGSNHWVFGIRPDVACYCFDCPFVEYLTDRESCLIGVIEIKFGAPLSKDLRRLTSVQRKQDVLAWMVYGDHFRPDVHARYYRGQLQREKKIRKWAASRHGRGASILKCGVLPSIRRTPDHDDVVEAYNSYYWIRSSR